MFSRLQHTGFSPEKLHDETVTIIGLGGLGIIVANMVVRLGVENFILIDRDTVGEENLNRLGYEPKDVGKSKTKATKEKIEQFNKLRNDTPLNIETYPKNIIAWERLRDIIERSNIVIGCLDNLKARIEVNYWTVKLEKPFVDGGTSQNGLRGRVDTYIPHEFPCLGCYYDSPTLTSIQDTHKDHVCDRSLPTTMNLIASLQVDQTIRILLEKAGIYPKILVNLEDQVKISTVKNVKKREDCRFCEDNE